MANLLKRGFLDTLKINNKYGMLTCTILSQRRNALRLCFCYPHFLFYENNMIFLYFTGIVINVSDSLCDKFYSLCDKIYHKY
jgi:hypothetical protein